MNNQIHVSDDSEKDDDDEYLMNDINFECYDDDRIPSSTYVIDDSEIRMPSFNTILSIRRFEEFTNLQSGMKPVIIEENEAVDENHDLLINNRDMKVEETDGYVDLIHSAMNNAHDVAAHNSIRNRLIRSLNEQFGDLCNVSVSVHPEKPNITLPLFSSIQEVSTAFTLTIDQHRAFYIASAGLLSAFKADVETEENSLNIQEDTMNYVALLLHGIGGSGKSYVIRAILGIAKSWLREGSVVTTCISGVAAVNVSGYTVASLLHCRKSFFEKVTYIY